MSSIIVYHSGYGCETGCCGHRIEIDGDDRYFDFAHPVDEDHFEWAKELVAEHCGADHVADLDWENCIISED